MKLEHTTGCTAYSLKIDGRDTDSMNSTELSVIAIELINNFSDKIDPADLQYFIEEIVDHFGVWGESHYCEQCGDTVTTTTLEI